MRATRRRGLPNLRPPGERVLVLRLIFGLLLAAGLISFAIYVATGNPVWRQRGLVTVKWTVIAGLGAAAILVLEELAVLL
jgi:ABC-type polysaccharide/polyol phosphate export permease